MKPTEPLPEAPTKKRLLLASPGVPGDETMPIKSYVPASLAHWKSTVICHVVASPGSEPELTLASSKQVLAELPLYSLLFVYTSAGTTGGQ